MAITIQQEPTTPNVANSDVVFLATSNTSSSPQYQFVVDIKDASNSLIQRVKQQPNPSNKGVFNFGQLLPQQTGPADKIWDTSIVAPNTASGKEFKIYFGEEYGASVSSSVTLYTPTTTGSLFYFMLDGFVNESGETQFNWNSSSKYDEEDASDDVTFSHQNGLTLWDTSSVRVGDYHTISFLNGNCAGAPSTSSAQNVFAATCKQYNSAGTLISSSIIYNENIYNDPATEIWTQVYTSQSEATRLVHFPVTITVCTISTLLIKCYSIISTR